MSATTLYLPTLGKEIPRPWFLPDAETLESQRRILAGTYFLVNISGGGGLGEALVCDTRKGGCGGKHEYLTLRCVEQPFSALTGGLYAYFRAIRDNGLASALSPSERLRLDAIGGKLGNMPDVGRSHPELAQTMTAGLGPNDVQLSGLALGILEPIPPSLARRYRDKINARGIRPRFDLPGLES